MSVREKTRDIEIASPMLQDWADECRFTIEHWHERRYGEYHTVTVLAFDSDGKAHTNTLRWKE